MKKQRNVFQISQYDKSAETGSNETEMNNLPNRRFILTISMHIEVMRTMHKQSDIFNKR